MFKKVLLIVVVLSLGFAGGLVFRDYSGKKQDSTLIPVQNYNNETVSKSPDNEKPAEKVPAVTPPPLETKPEIKNSTSAASLEEKKPTAPEESGTPKPVAANQDQTPTLQSGIEQKYNSRFQSLASLYEGKLNGLVGAAMLEYNTAKKSDPKADIKPLFDKYYAQGKSLEAECDSQFYSILAAFESELAANSLPLEAVARARQSYESRKSSRAGQLTQVNQ